MPSARLPSVIIVVTDAITVPKSGGEKGRDWTGLPGASCQKI